MLIKNILAGFKVTEIFLIDHHKLVHCESPAPSLLQSVDPAYVSMLGCTPSKKISIPKPIFFQILSMNYMYYKKEQFEYEFCDELAVEEKKSRRMLWKDMYSLYESYD